MLFVATTVAKKPRLAVIVWRETKNTGLVPRIVWRETKNTGLVPVVHSMSPGRKREHHGHFRSLLEISCYRAPPAANQLFSFNTVSSFG
ncbi:hypothetical protein NL676_002387 [Syzygium grande]|nr:hypothetical protein NL676_002387 [Syzygium grande]